MDDIDKIVDSFSTQIALIQYQQGRAISKSLAYVLDKEYLLAKSQRNGQGPNAFIEALLVRRPSLVESLDRRIPADAFNLHQMREKALEQQNRECQWYLVESYELYEKFLVRAYATLGFVDRNSWRCSDFGDVSISDIDKQDHDWYLSQVRLRYNGNFPKIAERMRKIFSAVEELENSNRLAINFKLMLATIEQLRHTIVHAGGIVENIDAFIERVTKSIGRNAGKEHQRAKSIIAAFFSKCDSRSTIFLRPEYVLGNIHESTPCPKLEELQEILLLHADLIGRAIREKTRTIKSEN